jgi:hypothetical protein
MKSQLVLLDIDMQTDASMLENAHERIKLNHLSMYSNFPSLCACESGVIMFYLFKPGDRTNQEVLDWESELCR